jgi:hypothetical protein
MVDDDRAARSPGRTMETKRGTINCAFAIAASRTS